ncbi:4-(cytidine 5'-diphospho)-2-C-methyl-D-erythritol kinase [Roseospira visakhapatnamensis]|uniref:4-diphosphocytidyl-2-C-methyl-D-erythritol kinase n=1 Tax=Roseospira visakhapatnamensis TaxID=390880 RepID=A0A7W6RGA6_9PROT|nr:4-diphosphocytidyl-2-C-methyl-D-erythritol kinase [Roseospira visakhapatnamensis]
MTVPSPSPSPSRASDPALRLAAPAKVNLFLHVVGRRPDGYHLLDSLVAFAGVFDTVLVAPPPEDEGSGEGEGEALSLTVEGPNAGALADLSGDDNLILRAARALAEAGGVAPRARVTLVKRLPVAGGIGGGSADAAAALRGLYRLWGLTLGDGPMLDLALSLGADVPVCLFGRAAHMTGIGEGLTPAPSLPAVPMVLINPGVPVSTPAVFRDRSGPFSHPAPLRDAPINAIALANELILRRNDLERPARGLADAVGDALALLTDQPGALLTRMSGSGATCFALFGTEAEAEQARAYLAALRPAWWVERTVLVSDARALDAQA